MLDHNYKLKDNNGVCTILLTHLIKLSQNKVSEGRSKMNCMNMGSA